MAKMIKHAHEDHEIELFAELADVVGRELPKFDLQSAHAGRELRLLQIFVLGIQPEHAIGSAALHLHGVKTGVTADVENRFARQTVGNDMAKSSPFHCGVVTKK